MDKDFDALEITEKSDITIVEFAEEDFGEWGNGKLNFDILMELCPTVENRLPNVNKVDKEENDIKLFPIKNKLPVVKKVKN